MSAANEPRKSKAERTAEAREKAREIREAQLKKDKRNKLLIGWGIVAAVVAILAVVALVVTTSIRQNTPIADQGPVPANANVNGAFAAAVTFREWDGMAVSTGSDNIAATITATNDAPTATRRAERLGNHGRRNWECHFFGATLSSTTTSTRKSGASAATPPWARPCTWNEKRAAPLPERAPSTLPLLVRKN